MIVSTLFFGALFGALLQYARLNRFNTISGMATLEDYTVAKALAVAIGIGAILLNVAIFSGLASFHVKPFILGGIVIGGLIFGAGMAVLGIARVHWPFQPVKDHSMPSPASLEA